MKSQLCHVTNKAQLLVAFGCALDFDGVTDIVLNGKTHYKLSPKQSGMNIFNKEIKRTRNKIRRTPAECFR
jgi:hypothetical protein